MVEDGQEDSGFRMRALGFVLGSVWSLIQRESVARIGTEKSVNRRDVSKWLR